MKLLFQSLALLLGVVPFFTQCQSKTTFDTLQNTDNQAHTAYILPASNTIDSTNTGLVTYLEEVANSLTLEVPVLRLKGLQSDEERIAQDIAMSNLEYTVFTRDSLGRPLRNEVFSIVVARESDILKKNQKYWNQGSCYKIEMYNFALNLTTVGLVNIPTGQVFQITHYSGMQPELPSHLKELAIQIAIRSKDLQKNYGGTPQAVEALMSDTKTALNASRCERSKHLCVAPTFVKGEKALWAIVDLTDLRLVGMRWTNLGNTPTVTTTVSERQLQNEFISECFCKTEVPIKKQDWDLHYMITSNDGLRVSNVKYKGKTIIDNAKLVDWHVSYSKTDGFGYSDAVGCPYFSSATVVAVEPPVIADLKEGNKTIGFTIEQYYRSDGWPSPCNYQYFQRYEFYNDGRFRVAAANIGRGCGNDGTYRPVFRIALAGDDNQVDEWDGINFKPIEHEGWRLQQATTRYNNEAMFRFTTGNSTYRLIPGNGQFKDGGRGDNAYIYFTRKHYDRNEGETDLPTIGSCCNHDYKQGPEKFIEPTPESIVKQPVVIWYVPQIKNDDTPGKEYCWAKARLVNGVHQTEYYPCIAGPMFVPQL